MVLLAFIALAAGTDSTLAVVVVTAAVVIGNEFAVLSVIWFFLSLLGGYSVWTAVHISCSRISEGTRDYSSLELCRVQQIEILQHQ